jgi:hypothetical protein
MDFVSRVRTTVDHLIADPERRTSIDYGVRYWPVERFPYVVFYDLTESELLVLGGLGEVASSSEVECGEPSDASADWK